jgi:predicted RNA-binding Zn-ribbon protein involved in translation (DUF1610 family)
VTRTDQYDSSQARGFLKNGNEHSEVIQLSNVTLGNQKEENSYFPCPICGEMLLVEITKNQKPYCKCNDCGIQLFIRGKSGVERFRNLLGKGELRDSSRDLVRTLDYFDYLRKKLEEIQEEKPIFGIDPDIDLQERLVKRQLIKLRLGMRNHISE